jgi:hypothetical protein
MITERLPIVRDSDILFAPRMGRVLPTIHLGPASARLPRGIGVARLRHAPAEWPRQYASDRHLEQPLTPPTRLRWVNN